VQVSRVDLDGRRIDFRLVREGEELTSRALRDKGLAHDDDEATGVPRKASLKRAARKTSDAQKRALPSPIQALKASVKAAAKKVVDKAKGKGRKTRR
jgi:ribonuclease R